MSDRDFRLSKEVMPARYALRIDVDLDNWRFTATEQIEVRVQRPVTTIALHAVDLGKIRLGMRVGVFGCGPIGLLVLQLARAAGATQVYFKEPLPHRCDAALSTRYPWFCLLFSESICHTGDRASTF